MTLNIQEALHIFMQCDKEMQETLKTLREAVKKSGSEALQVYINEENFDMANQIISELNNFTNLEYNSNAQTICDFAEKIIENQPELPQKIDIMKQTERQIANISIVKENNVLDTKEKELIQTLGYTSVSRIQDSQNLIDEETILSLNDKGYVSIEELELEHQKTLVFELNEKGKKAFEREHKMEPNESLKSQLVKKYNSLSTGFFLYDVENALQEREYKINEIGIHQIEMVKDKRHTYLTPDLGRFDDEEYFKILDRKNQLKNIGFVCIDETVMKQAKKATREWAERNESKCKFLSVHFTTISQIKDQPNIFETISF